MNRKQIVFNIKRGVWIKSNHLNDPRIFKSPEKAREYIKNLVRCSAYTIDDFKLIPLILDKK